VRPRKGKAQEQVDKQRDKFREEQQHGRSRDRRQRQSRVRARFDTTIRYGSENEFEFGNQEVTQNGGL